METSRDLSEHLKAHRDLARQMGGAEAVGKQHEERQAHRARTRRPALRRGHVSRIRHPRHAPFAATGYEGQGHARGWRDHRSRDDPRPAGLRRGLRLYRHGRHDGRGRRAQSQAHARARASRTHADRVAARFRGRTNPGSRRRAVRGHGLVVFRPGPDVRDRPPGRCDHGADGRRNRHTFRRSRISFRWSRGRLRWRSRDRRCESGDRRGRDDRGARRLAS